MPVELNPRLLAIEKQSNRKRKLVSWLTIISIITCMFLLWPKPAHADDADSFLDPANCADCFVDTIIDLTSGYFVKTTLEDYYNSGVVEQIVSDITGQTKSWMSSLTAALKAVATLLIIYHMIVTLLKELQRGEMTLESWLRILISFIIPAVIIAEFDVFIKAFASTGQWIYGILPESIQIEATQSAGGVKGMEWPDWSDPWYKWYDFDIWVNDAVAYCLVYIKSLILVVAYFIVDCVIITMIIAALIGTYIELVLRHLFMPLAIANISYEGARSAGVRYVKKYLGCYMRVAGIIVAVCAIFYIYNLLVTTATGQFEKILYFLILVPGTKKAIQMTNEIITDALGD